MSWTPFYFILRYMLTPPSLNFFNWPWSPLFLPHPANTKIIRTDRQTDGRLDGPTDGRTTRLHYASGRWRTEAYKSILVLPVKTTYPRNVWPMLGHRRRRWANIGQALCKCVVIIGLLPNHTQDGYPMLCKCWTTVYNDRAALIQLLSCLLEGIYTNQWFPDSFILFERWSRNYGIIIKARWFNLKGKIENIANAWITLQRLRRLVICQQSECDNDRHYLPWPWQYKLSH